MTVELRQAMRQARLENGRILAVNVANQRQLGVYSSTGRRIGYFAALSEAEYAEASAWWARNGQLPAPTRAHSCHPARSPLDSPA